MRNRLLLFLPAVLCSTLLSAQVLRGGLSADLGFSSQYLNDPEVDFIQTAPSGNLGAYVEGALGKKTSLGLEGLISHYVVRFESAPEVISVQDDLDNEVELAGFRLRQGTLHTTFLASHLYVRQRVGPVGFTVGVQQMVRLYASKRTRTEELFEDAFQETLTTSIEPFSPRYDIGPRLGVDVQVNTRWRLRTNYYYGLRDVLDADGQWYQNNTQFTVGVNYALGWYVKNS